VNFLLICIKQLCIAVHLLTNALAMVDVGKLNNVEEEYFKSH